MRLGIHTRINQGFVKAAERMARLQCNACQMFSRSPRGGKARALSQEEVNQFRDLCMKNDINPVAIHIPYVLNLATSDPEMHQYAVDMVKEDMSRANLLGASYLVLHMGSHKGDGTEKGLAQVAKALNEAIKNYHGEAMLLLENTSGAGSEVGSTFEQLKYVLDELKIPRAGICFDTCHGFAAGYDLTDKAKVDETLRKLDEVVSLANLKLIHANDSMFPLGSTKDRHAVIGQGYIGEKGFKAIFRHPLLKNVPFILEIPVDSDEDWERNLKAVRRLAGS
ncbi:MAG: endonuclease [Firmicutes bacterium HGW-Firmicutes-8]|nr:MAG: endonuclease [Firmicutes bacterium HGW-Firmicutes-8]